MSWYGDHVFPRVLDRALDTAETRRIRAEVCAPLRGDVLEIGFGTGLNLPHLPAAVERLCVVDPMERGRSFAADRIAASAVPVEFVGLDGIQRRVACGCNLDRDIPAVLAAGGLTLDRQTTYYGGRGPRIMGWMYQGVASAA